MSPRQQKSPRRLEGLQGCAQALKHTQGQTQQLWLHREEGPVGFAVLEMDENRQLEGGKLCQLCSAVSTCVTKLNRHSAERFYFLP